MILPSGPSSLSVMISLTFSGSRSTPSSPSINSTFSVKVSVISVSIGTPEAPFDGLKLTLGGWRSKMKCQVASTPSIPMPAKLFAGAASSLKAPAGISTTYSVSSAKPGALILICECSFSSNSIGLSIWNQLLSDATRSGFLWSFLRRNS